MGRTNPTFRSVLDRYARRWKRFRRALRREDQPHFDRLLTKARRHADAASHANDPNPEATILLSILLEQEKELAELGERLDEREGDGL